jgi:hypothetical protein
MTPDQVTLVQESFAKVAPISDTAAVLFYDRLFEVAPSVKSMFPADMTEQRKKLMATLAFVVNGLGDFESILPAASDWRHATSTTAREKSTIRGRRRPCCGRWKRDSETARPGSRRCLTAARDAVRLYDLRSIRPLSGRRVRIRRERNAGCRRQRNGRRASGRRTDEGSTGATPSP